MYPGQEIYPGQETTPDGPPRSSSSRHYASMVGRKERRLMTWDGILTILAGMAAPWGLFFGGEQDVSLRGAIGLSVIAGILKGKEWVDEVLARLREERAAAKAKKDAPDPDPTEPPGDA